MITEKQITVYSVICDKCGADHGECAEFQNWEDSSMAIEDAIGDGWIETDNGDHLCEDCQDKEGGHND